MADKKAIVDDVSGALQAAIKKHYSDWRWKEELPADLEICGTLLKPAPEASRIDAHGVTKVSIFHNISQLVDLLVDGIDRKRSFSTAPLASSPDLGSAMGTASGGAYTHGLFIVISDAGKSLSGDPKQGHGIKAVLVNPAVHELVPVLQKHFPSMPFVTFDKANDYLFSVGMIDSNTRDQSNISVQETMAEYYDSVSAIRDLMPASKASSLKKRSPDISSSDTVRGPAKSGGFDTGCP